MWIVFSGFISGFDQRGQKRGVMGYWGAKWYDPPGSEHTFDKQWDPRIYMFPDQGHIVKVWYFV